MKNLLDADLMIKAFDRGEPEAKERMRALLQDENNSFAITPMIMYEVLCGISWDNEEKYQKLRERLEGFKSIPVSSDIAHRAESLFRCARFNDEVLRNDPTKRNEHKFDIFHFATAKEHDLTVQTCNQKDFNAMESAYKECQETSA